MKFSSQLHLYNRAINIGLHKMITKLDSGSIEQTILPFKQRILSKSIIQLLAIIDKQCVSEKYFTYLYIYKIV
jgi:hypothetical protein